MQAHTYKEVFTNPNCVAFPLCWSLFFGVMHLSTFALQKQLCISLRPLGLFYTVLCPATPLSAVFHTHSIHIHYCAHSYLSTYIHSFLLENEVCPIFLGESFYVSGVEDI